MIGRRGGRGQRRPVVLEAFEHLGLASSGTQSAAGRSSSSLPCSTSCIAAVPVTALVIDAIQTDGIGGHGDAAADHAFAEPALVDRAVPVGRRRHHAGHIALRHRTMQYGVGFALQRHRVSPLI